MKRLLSLFSVVVWLLVAPQFAPALRAEDRRSTENVILLMTDGLRWQEVFSGAEEVLMSQSPGGVKELDALRAAFWRETPQARREALMPFFWSVVAKQGQVYGNQSLGSIAQVTNGMNFSYPGYNETLSGFADPRIDSNDKRPNPNITVFEWLNRKPAFFGKVAAFGVWDVFPFIFNRDRCGFTINAGFEPVTMKPMTPRIELLNTLKAESTRYWIHEPFDSLTIHSALEYLREQKPRLFFLSLNETDAWGHEGRYDQYLYAAHRADACFRSVWETVQAIAQYQGKTTIILVPDHGRGDAPVEWKNHGKKTPRSEFIWMGFLGPDTPALGERSGVPLVTQGQIAATLAALLGEDYCAAVPQAAPPIADVVSPGR